VTATRDAATHDATACADCLRHAWLLSSFAGYGERLRRSKDDLVALLSLDDPRLLELARRGHTGAAIQHAYDRFDVAAARAACQAVGVRPICRHDAHYPSILAELPGAPAVLYASGDPARLASLLDAPAAAIVGARRASPYALEVADGLGSGLSSAGVTVVSGMANGVDSAAHAGAIRSRSATIAVLAGGPDVAYPAAKRALHRRLARDAAVVSEWPPGFSARPWCFLARNRIIAGLAGVTIVVEAGDRSGSLTTASFAADYGRTVGAVPGRVTAAGAAGSNALLFDGVAVVRDARDALELACGLDPGRTRTPDREELRGGPPDEAAAPLPKRQRRLLEAIEQGHESQESLFELASIGPRGLADLTQLELLGLVRRAPGGRYVRTAARVAPRDGAA
jgi:DNA processing protein